MSPKRKTDLDTPLQTDATDLRLVGRDYRALLRSTGHLKRDGRWIDGEDSAFLVYREEENPGLGALRGYQASEYFRRYDPGEPQFGPQSTFNWRPGLGRAFVFDDVSEHVEVDLPDPVDPVYEDHTFDLNNKGTTFIRQLRPGNPLGTLGQFLVELHELPRLPLLFRSRAKHFRDLGSEYLNVEFGWRPFVQDVINLGHTQLRIDAELAKIRKNNGIRVKRRSKRVKSLAGRDDDLQIDVDHPFGWALSDFEDPLGENPLVFDEEIRDLISFGPYNSSFDSSITGSGKITISNRLLTETWYVGTFQYYVPDTGSSEWTNRAKGYLSGTFPTPSILYSVYPWTWLADWFSNVGDILSNLSTNAVDNEALFDSHVMETITNRHSVKAELVWDQSVQQIGGVPYVVVPSGHDTVEWSSIKKTKLRRQASPFGFGLTTDAFSFRQRSILAALLFSRKVPKLRHPFS